MKVILFKQRRCIRSRLRGSRGLMTEEDVKARGVGGIFLQTDIDKPAFNFYTKNEFINLEKHVSLFKVIK
jgi:aminoglycoside 6'-N-acetyltransferase I